MAIRIINTTLLVITVIGVVFAYRAASEQHHLLTEQERLEAKVGSLPIRDPSKPHVLAMPTGEELHFEWRVYVPAGVTVEWEQGNGLRGSISRNGDAVEFVARVRLRENEQGEVDIFTKGYSESCCSRLGDRQLAGLLRGRWNRIQVEQLGAEGVAVVEANEVVTMLRLTLPDDLKREANQVLDEHTWERIENDLFTLQIGSDKAFQRAKAEGQSDGS